MDQSPLVSEMINAGAKLASAFDRYASLQAAFWLKDGEYGHWRLYLVSDQITDANSGLAFLEVHRLLRPEPNIWLESMQVRSVGIDNRIAKDVIEMQQLYPNPYGQRLGSQLLGGEYVADVYIYPIPVLAPA
jgi:hypothetical protein